MDRDVRESVDAGGDLLFGVTMGGREEEDGVIVIDDSVVDDDCVRQSAVAPVAGPELEVAFE